MYISCDEQHSLCLMRPPRKLKGHTILTCTRKACNTQNQNYTTQSKYRYTLSAIGISYHALGQLRAQTDSTMSWSVVGAVDRHVT